MLDRRRGVAGLVGQVGKRHRAQAAVIALVGGAGLVLEAIELLDRRPGPR